MTRAAVTMITDELIQEGLLLEIGTAQADFGRKPILLDLNPERYRAAGISITRTGCSLGLMDIKGRVLAAQAVYLQPSWLAEQNIQAIVTSLRSLLQDHQISWDRLLGIGISIPGPVDVISGEVLNPPNFTAWHHVNVVEAIARQFPVAVAIENNATALALAEKSYGRGSVYASFMLLVVDTGVGAGLIIRDQIYRGFGGFGSEVGHTSINYAGPTCSCGNRGCLEIYAAIPSVLARLRSCGRSESNWQAVVERAKAGDRVCLAAIRTEACFLAAGIVNAMNILELDAVILAGDISIQPELLLTEIRRQVDCMAMTRQIRQLPIVSSDLTDQAAVLSAGSTILERYFQEEITPERRH